MSQPPTISRRMILLWVFALALAYAAPRLVAYRGIPYSPRLEYHDMNRHQVNLDLIEKNDRLGSRIWAEPYLGRHPEAVAPMHPMRWPHGVYTLANLWSGTLGPLSIWTVQLTNLFFSVLLAVGLVLLGRDVLGDLRLGMWGALLALLSPCLFAAGWYLSLDYPLAAMVVVGLWILYRSNGFTRPGYSAILALWSALGLWVKLTYAAYLLIPSVAALVLTLRRGPGRARLVALGLAASSAAAALLLGLLLIEVDLVQIGDEMTMHLISDRPNQHFELDLIPAWTGRWLAAIPMFAVNSFPWPLLLLLLPGFVLAHHPRRPLPGRWLLLSFVWGIYLVLTLMANKLERYLLPLYPMLCLLGVWGLAQMASGRWRRVVLAGAAAAFAAMLLAVHFWPTPWLMDERSRGPEAYMYELHLPGARTLASLRRHGGHHPECDLRALMRQAEALARTDRTRGLLKVAMHWEQETPGETVFRERGIFWSLRTYLAHALRDRMVLEPTERPEDPLTDLDLETPALLVLHPPGYDTAAAHPGALQLIGRARAEVVCDGGEDRAVGAFSLYRTRLALELP